MKKVIMFENATIERNSCTVEFNISTEFKNGRTRVDLGCCAVSHISLYEIIESAMEVTENDDLEGNPKYIATARLGGDIYVKCYKK